MASVELCAESVTRQDQGGDMRVVIVGQQAFGKAVLEAFVGRGDTIAGVFAAPEKPGSRPDPLLAAAAASLCFDKSIPRVVEALLQAGDRVPAGRATEWTQDEGQATYEGWVREAEARINWANHVDFIYDLIRGCNPVPGAWTTLKSEAGEQKLYLFDSKKIMAPTFGSVRGKKLGEVVSACPEGVRIHAQGGFIECSRLRLGDGAKVKPSEIDLPVGTILGA